MHTRLWGLLGAGAFVMVVVAPSASLAAVADRGTWAHQGDIVMCAGRVATIVGTADDDRLRGTSGDDVIAGLGGHDTIKGLRGDDVVCGGPGDDNLTSYDQGRDVIIGNGGSDFVASFVNPHARVRTGPGDDYASVAVGMDPGWSFAGGAGRDQIYLQLDIELAGVAPVPATLDLRDGRASIRSRPGRPAAAGVFSGWEDLDLPNLRWQAAGRGADERFLFDGAVGIRVLTRGGDDEVFGTIGDDVIATGAGEDTVTAYGGRDVCRGAEHTRGCEVRR